MLDQDTSEKSESNIEHYIRYNDELETIPEESDEDLPVTVQGDSNKMDTIPYTPWDSEDKQFNTAIDDTSEDPIIVMGKPLTTAFVSTNVHIPTEKVGYLQVTNKLREFLKHFPPESKERAFEQIFEILQVLDAYLRDNPQQHIHCMSPDREYVSLIMYAITIEIDLCNFPAIWAVLSILLDTQSNTLLYVTCLQQVINNYYDKCPMDVMSTLKQQANDISTFSEKGDQECPGHDFLMSQSAVRYVSLCFFQKRGLEITVFLFFNFSFLGNFVLTTLFLFEILVIASLGGAARRT